MRQENTIEAFLALVRGGLWEQDVKLHPYGNLNFNEVMHLAEEQSVAGLVTAGLEHVIDIKVPKEIVLQFIGQTLQLEKRNAAMNRFIGETIEKLRESDINTLLVKGQGVAQCYERPQWRSSGDIDFLFNKDNYNKAVSFFNERIPKSKNGGRYSKETAFYTDQWMIEAHGTLRTSLSTRVDRTLDEVQRTAFCEGKPRSWINGNTRVFLPGVDEDVFFVFTHFIKHFYKEGGVSIRQLCDWCRLLWTYRDGLDAALLKKRIVRAGLMSEWNSFAAVAVECLGMPVEAMPLYCADNRWSKNAEKILKYILKGREWRPFKDTLTVGCIFPFNTLRFTPGIFLSITWLKIKERFFVNNG